MTVGHSPLPWYTMDRGEDAKQDIRCENGEPVASTCVQSRALHGPTREQREADAEFIVRAVNAHGEIVEALRHFVDFIEKAKDSGLTPKADYSQFATCIWQARIVLAKAERGQS